MSQYVRRTVIIANWKMNKTISEAKSFVTNLDPLIQTSSHQILLAVPFTMIKTLSEMLIESKIQIGAQNMNDASEGAFTGEIAAKMLVDAGAKFVLLGHSERRRYFHETNEWINKKAKRAVAENLPFILCVGETLQEKEEGKTAEVIKEQLQICLRDIPSEKLGENGDQILIAYEPVWAIGTGKTATPNGAEEVHQLCRSFIAELWGEDSANKISILYGGSVTPENSKLMMEKPDIDGLLVGGASLSLDSFTQIVNDTVETPNSEYP